MRIPPSSPSHVTFALLLVLLPSAFSAPVRVSFLTEPSALQDTLTVSREAGCRPESIRIYQRAVERYTSSTFEINFSKFPNPRDGFHCFDSASALVAAVAHPLCDTPHAYEFNCFDAVIALTGDSLRTSIRPDDLASPFWVPYTPTNGSFAIIPRATARDAFELVYADWYRTATSGAFPKSRNESRMALTAALFRCHLLPQSTTEAGLRSAVMAALRASWERDNVVFPNHAKWSCATR